MASRASRAAQGTRSLAAPEAGGSGAWRAILLVWLLVVLMWGALLAYWDWRLDRSMDALEAEVDAGFARTLDDLQRLRTALPAPPQDGEG